MVLVVLVVVLVMMIDDGDGDDDDDVGVGTIPHSCGSEVPHHNVYSMWTGGWSHAGRYNHLPSSSAQSPA